MVFSTVLRTLRAKYHKLNLNENDIPDLKSSASRSTHLNFSTLTSSIRRGRPLMTKKHNLLDPRSSLQSIHEDVSWNGPQLCGNTVTFYLEAPSTPVNRGFPLDPASIEVEMEKEEEAINNVFHVHTELVRPASVVFARHIARGRSTIPVPGQDRDVVQLFVRFLYSSNIHSNVADAFAITDGCETLNFKLRNGSFAQLQTPDDEEKLLVKAYLFGYSYSCWTFCDALIDTLICKIIGQKRTPILHGLLDLNSCCASYYPLKILIAHLAIYTWSDNQFYGFARAHKFDRMDHVRFWADVGDYNAVYKTGAFGLPKAPWKKNPCHYHVHTWYPKMGYTCYVQER